MVLKRTFLKIATAMLCCAALCFLSVNVGSAASYGLEIRSDADVIHLPLAAAYTPYYRSIPDGVTREELLVSFSNNGIIRKVTFESDNEYQMVGVGQTELTVQTPDGMYADSVTIVVDPAMAMTSDRVMVYTNTRYQSRTFSYTPPRDGVYALSFSLPDAPLHFTEVYDEAFQKLGTPSGDKTIGLVGGKTYYFRPIADSDIMGNSYEFRVEYVGDAVEEPSPSSIRFARNEITMMLGDIAAFPHYTFEPGAREWYDTVTFTSDNDDVLYIDYEENAVEALSAGTATLTVTADTWGWSDTVRITVVDEERELHVDEPLPLTIYDGEYRTVFFTAPRTGAYTFYSVTEGEGDPIAGIFDAQSEESLAVGDDENGNDFIMTAELKQQQRVEILVAGYTDILHTTLYAGTATAATGVELYLPEAISHHDDRYYVTSGNVSEPLVRFLGEPTAELEEYDILADFYDGAERDENGDYHVCTGQAVRFTVTTDSGLTDTIMVIAVDLLPGDLDFDGRVDASDAATLFYAINGAIKPDAATLGAMEINGDNRVTLADAARLFYYVNGILKSI